MYVDGNEYRNIFPAWDWNKIPGTTVELVPGLTKDDPKGVGITNKSDFVGGVSDGTNGLCAMELIRGKLAAKKSWFFFDHIYLCLGAGINSESDRDVVTCINQCHLVGDVVDDHDSAPRSQGQHDLKGVRWLTHNHVGYVFPEAEKVELSNANQSGRWSDFGTGSDALVTLPVFNLWIDHGSGCKDAKYEYFVLPTATAATTGSWAAAPDVQILANTPATQAAFDQKSKTAQITFWFASQLKTPLGDISVDQPCLLMVHDDGQGIAVTAANPKNQAMELNVNVGDKSIKISLPDGLQAGSSVTQRLKM
jgi:chondroitin AC lyase